MRGLHLEPGMRVGLLGGSFNPAHEGHLLISRLARKHLGLARVIWLVAQRNPLKCQGGLPPIGQRIAAAQKLTRRIPTILVSDFEEKITGGRTSHVLKSFCARQPGLRAVWIMGADSWAGFAKWHRWRSVAGQLPIAIFPRPGSNRAARCTLPAQALAHRRIDPADSRRLPFARPPAFCFLETPSSVASSSAVRLARNSGGMHLPP